MTEQQIDYLWHLAHQADADPADLRVQFPAVDWDAAQARREARWAAERAARALEPSRGITLAGVDAVTREIFTKTVVDGLFEESPLLGRLRR